MQSRRDRIGKECRVHFRCCNENQDVSYWAKHCSCYRRHDCHRVEVCHRSDAVTGEMKTSSNFYGGNIPETELYENKRCIALGDCKELAETRMGVCEEKRKRNGIGRSRVVTCIHSSDRHPAHLATLV